MDISGIHLQLKNENGKVLVWDIIRKKWLQLTKEEHVRQYFLHYIIHKKNYPSSLIAVEKMIKLGDRKKRFDVVVYDRNHKPWMLVECKEPHVSINQQTLFQLLNYQRIIQSNYWVMTNGHQLFCANADAIENLKWTEELPAYE